MVWAGGRYPPSIFYIYAWHSWHWSFRFFSIIAILILTWDVFLQLYVHGEKFNQPIFHCNNIAGHVDPVSRIDLLYTFSGEVWLPSCQFQVVPDNEHRALYSTHSFKILSKEGGCGTFVPLFFNLISSVRQYNQRTSMEAQPQMDPLQAASTPVDEMMRHAYVSISLFIFHDYKDYICLIYIYYHYYLFIYCYYYYIFFHVFCRYVDPNDPTRIFLQQPTQESQLRRRTYNPHAVESSIWSWSYYKHVLKYVFKWAK